MRLRPWSIRWATPAQLDEMAEAAGIGVALDSGDLGHLFGEDQARYVITVPADLAEHFRAGDRLIVVQSSGALLHVPSEVASIVDDAVSAAVDGFARLSDCDDEQISAFFDAFADRLDDATSTGIYGVLDYGYDDVGNRISLMLDGGAPTTYNYKPVANQLDNTTGTTVHSFVYDANGNTLTPSRDHHRVHGRQ